MERQVSILFSKNIIDFLDELLYVLYEKNILAISLQLQGMCLKYMILLKLTSSPFRIKKHLKY